MKAKKKKKENKALKIIFIRSERSDVVFFVIWAYSAVYSWVAMETHSR
jgi:hypothetical protein